MDIPACSKICSRCKKPQLATSEFFRRHSRYPDGLEKVCKICRKREYQHDKTRIRQMKRDYLARTREHHLQWEREYWKARPEKRNQKLQRYRAKHSEKQRARDRAGAAVKRAVKHGELIKPQRCQRCSRAGVLQAHHYLGYAEEHYLLVEWLCSDCHHRAHRP